MIGYPKFCEGDRVKFKTNRDGIAFENVGTIFIVDAYGTFEQDREVSYDIMVDNFEDTGKKCLVKHVTENGVERLGI